MVLQTSGPISLANIQTEFGGSNPISLSEYYGAYWGIPTSGAISIGDFYGATSITTLTSGLTVNGQPNRKIITVSNYIKPGNTLIIPSNYWVWSDQTFSAALTINIPCTVINYGKVIGRGGNGGASRDPAGGQAGGPAISVTSSGVTIQNMSGAYIAGGGGGGGGSRDVGGGGGAGGGVGGYSGLASVANGYGGVLNAAGSNGSADGYSGGGGGGGAGGGGGGSPAVSGYDGYGGGGGGGRILPGSGGYGGKGPSFNNVNYVLGGTGGSANNAGGVGVQIGFSGGIGGGGGGWGAAGGVDGRDGNPGGAGGAAITGTSRTLINSGTIYGST